MKKVLLFLFILVVASLLFTNNNTKTSASNADEIVEIIEDSSSSQLSDGYVSNGNIKENSNFFVNIIKVISNLFKSIIDGLFTAAGKIISIFTS